MPDTVTGFRRIRDRLRARGFVVHEVTHWETRGSGTLRPAGKVNHHTAGGRAGGNTGSLRLVTFGRADLRNALCNWYTARNGELWIVAALTAWHAGSGSWGGVSGNSRVIGNEAENDGLGEPWSQRSLAAQRALDEECVREFGYGTAMIPEHKEWTSRKPDRAGIHGPTWRGEVAAGLRSPAPTPTPAPIEEDDDMRISLAPGEEDVFHIEPTIAGHSALGVKKVIVVLNTHGGNRVPVHVYFQSEGGPGRQEVWGGAGPWAKTLSNRPGGWMHVRNDGNAHVGGRIIEVR